jgi:hypothetical protein
VLPRVICYFDDIAGDCEAAFNIFTGELLAIPEFNAANDDVKIAECRGLRFSPDHIPSLWHEQIYIAHLFRHPDYQRPIHASTQLPLSQRGQMADETVGGRSPFRGQLRRIDRLPATSGPPPNTGHCEAASTCLKRANSEKAQSDISVSRQMTPWG